MLQVSKDESFPLRYRIANAWYLENKRLQSLIRKKSSNAEMVVGWIKI